MWSHRKTGLLFYTAFRQLIFAVVLVGLATSQSPVLAVNEAAGDAADIASEAKGEDLYKRGFYEEALDVWTQAAAVGDAGAAFRLGEEYLDAKVVERDMRASLRYLKLGAEGGDARAQQDLATFYDNGWLVRRDWKRAAELYKAAADQGIASSQHNIGVMYREGHGVSQDLVKAYKYFLLAVRNGFARFATAELEQILPLMSPAQIKKATRLADEAQQQQGQ